MNSNPTPHTQYTIPHTPHPTPHTPNPEPGIYFTPPVGSYEALMDYFDKLPAVDNPEVGCP